MNFIMDETNKNTPRTVENKVNQMVENSNDKNVMIHNREFL